MILDTYKLLINNPSIYININPFFLRKIKSLIIAKYGSLRSFNYQRLMINYGTLKSEFRKSRYHPLPRILKIAKLIGINREEVFNNIKSFRISGSHRRRDIILSRKIKTNENFVEGYALYLAEGDTGLSGKKRPRKLRFTNSEIKVIKFFIQWLRSYFPGIDFYLNIILPSGFMIQKDFVNQLINDLDLRISQIKLSSSYYNKKIKYRACCDSAILIDLVLSLEKVIKRICLENKKLAAAYIRGMMIGEGTSYFNRARYVRIEMRNEKEIKYLYNLFQILGYNCKPSLRSNRENMWSIYIGAKQLKKFYDEIGFGIHYRRQRILEAAANKKLRVNQYI